MIKVLPMLAISGLYAATSSTAFGQSDSRDVIERGAVPGPVETRSQAVRYGDLDLQNPSGATTLVNRINGAARNVCSPEPVNPTDTMDNADYRACMRNAAGQAVDTLNAPAVTYAYKRRAEPR